MADVFTQHADIYDRSRRNLIPCFDAFYGTPARILEAHSIHPKRILDLGAGTGLLTAILSQSLDLHDITLLDQSEAMMEKGKAALSGIANVSLKVSRLQDLDQVGFETASFDAIWSALAIHHLTGPEKQTLFQTIHSLLRPGGIFINTDQSLGDTEDLEAIYRAQWLKDVRTAGADEHDIAMALERMEEDRMDTLSNQLKWLKEAGFTATNCWFQDFSFTVYSGFKPD